jgi:hypothetical protein
MRSLKYVVGEQLDVGTDMRGAPQLDGFGARDEMSPGTLPDWKNHILMPVVSNWSAKTPPPALLKPGPNVDVCWSVKPQPAGLALASAECGDTLVGCR